ncbi:putative signal-transduction protein containing cAMP-binding and CBS domains [Desulfosporosinus acidiphilus SJ4]|uniref:Putative signal-transduction protein containing cAMP-binding and CBS domains n=1 Tax=Desulfosporosinus acidiphilus (strain DSM 22704 / JCM 16185 / SJ4) TaxID=646529 RepID=I4D8E8_DESAJ|nr:CBS domain-containing protein [Desulfosporosinus acidiphilus]AFM42072.1 putative signal-transduction protein containing cAMP-binding and CBS domains [Desulfosporosinus acidiphilus SJ4]
MKVSDVMTSTVDWAGSKTSVADAARLMKKDDVGSIPICDNGKVVGMITDRDIVLNVVAAGKDYNTTLVQEIMSKNIVSVSSNQDVHEAADLMSQYQIRRLPVVDQGKLVGILAIGDLAIERIHVNEAGDALSDISRGAHQNMN